MLRMWGIFRTCGSPSKLASPFVPKKPLAGSSVWQPTQLKPAGSDEMSKGRPYRLMVMLMLITAIASPFLDNVTTIMLVAPVTIVVCARLGIAPQPYLIAEILASNIGGAATLIGDPPNIIIGSRAGLTFNDFIIHMTPIVAIVFVTFVLFTRVLFRRSFEYHPERVASVMALKERKAITDPKLLIRCMVVFAGIIVIVAFALLSYQLMRYIKTKMYPWETKL